MSLAAELAPRILPVVLTNLTTRYPYHDIHFFREGETSHDPFAVHPSFSNSFDWHSSVHSHWTAVALLNHYDNGEAPETLQRLRAVVESNLSATNVLRELQYLESHGWYERPYGWAWALKLASAAPHVRPIGAWVAAQVPGWIAMLPIPVRHGVHSNTAFALGLMWDAAEALEFRELQRPIAQRAKDWFTGDRDWPQHVERSGSDFLSPGMTEADLMRRVLPADEFRAWWNAFLPNLSPRSPILTPMDVPDVEDGHVVHLHGLNLSRASTLARIARVLGDEALLSSARNLYAASESRAFTGHYTETHWLPTFAWDAALAIDG